MNKGNIILSGGGDLEDSVGIDTKYFSLLKNNSKILYIPTALKRTRVGFEACYDWFSTVVSKNAQTKEIDFTMLHEEDPVPTLELYDSIYIGGGNTFKLLSYVKKVGLNIKLTEYVKNGGIIYGGSAGGIILGRDARTVEEENGDNIIDTDGLDLLKGKSVICHYTDSMEEKVLGISQRIESEVIALPENAGLILDSDGNILETVGEVFVFAKNKKTRI